MKFLKIIFKTFVVLIIVIVALVLIAKVTGNGYLVKGVQLSYLKGNNSANIYDGNDFDVNQINASTNPILIAKNTHYNEQKLTDKLSQTLNETKSTSFLLIKNDSIVQERYFLTHSDSTKSNSFSMAKTITTLLVQIAIEKKLIPSWDEKVVNYLPWLKGAYANQLTLRHLSCMQAGLSWDEAYKNPFSITAKAYYGDDIEETMKTVEVINKPGTTYKYQSGATQILGLALHKAVHMHISDFATKYLWQPLRTEKNATWHVDDNDTKEELTYCCFNATTRDFAKIGLMLLHNGKYNGLQIVDSSFVAQMQQAKLTEYYGQSVWIGYTKNNIKFYFLQGIQGQYVVVIPSKNAVVVRTGNAVLHKSDGHLHDCIYVYVEEALNLL